MNKRLFARLVESMEQRSEIARGERKPSRQFQVDAIAVKEIRAMTQLSQPSSRVCWMWMSARCATGSKEDASRLDPRRLFCEPSKTIPKPF